MRVAVSGVGGGVGQSIMKALTIASIPVSIYPIDVQPLSAGLFRGERGAVLPRPEERDGLEEWERWLVANKIDAIIPGSDHDVLPLAGVRDDWEDRGVCKVLVSDADLVALCRDKTAIHQRLEAEGIPVPATTWDIPLDEAVAWANSIRYPIVLKPRDGYASQDLHIVQDEEELRFFFNRTPNLMLQEYLSLSGEVREYTCSVFIDKSGSPIGTFMARRDLLGGTTYRAEINVWPEIRELLILIGKTLRPCGPLNVQLRVTERGPVPFELNIRCSGTSAVRAYFGYNEPEMLLRHYVLGEKLVEPKPRTGYVLRYWNEVFLEDVDEELLKNDPSDLKGRILAWP